MKLTEHSIVDASGTLKSRQGVVKIKYLHTNGSLK